MSDMKPEVGSSPVDTEAGDQVCRGLDGSKVRWSSCENLHSSTSTVSAEVDLSSLVK